MQDQEKLMQQLKDALVAIKKLKSDLLHEKEKNNEPIAIIGMAMRFPGNVTNEDDYWNLLINNTDAIEDIPESRFDVRRYYDKTPQPGKINLKQGGFLKEIDLFDAPFFDLTRIETESIDPQQRLLLEVSYEALENAGINITQLTDSNTGVFIGITNVDYQKKHFRSTDANLVNPYSYTGIAVGANAGRISYAFGLQGPSVVLDTACSSSLVAVHTAAQSLRNKDCNMAIVGAANIILEPELSIVFSSLNALSSDSRCKPFSNDANGFVRSEGCAVIILKRLSDAQKNKDNILAVIKGSAINQDGRSNGFTAPNVSAQTLLLKTALSNARIQPNEVSYIEAHGTGTKIGDPIEMEAISAVFSEHRSTENKLKIGSVKSNIGHTESVAGLASIIKTILSFNNNLLPKSLHFNTPNELINWNTIPIEVVQKNTPWNFGNTFAGISSFGVTGTNAHVIIGKENNIIDTENKASHRKDIFILPLSAKNENALKELTNKYFEFIQHSSHSLEDICAMATLRRAVYDYRETFVTVSKQDMLEKLKDFHDSSIEIQKSKFNSEDTVKTVFVFPGQGSQWTDMGRNLIENEPVFKDTLEKINQLLKQYVDWDLFDEIQKGDTRLHQIDIVQPVLTSIQIALANLWMSKGVRPVSVIGHSMGEIAAAYIAQKISLEDAILIICMRSKLMKTLSGKGEMGATDLTVEEATQLLKGKEDKLSIAVINSKNSTVLSGDAEALNEVFMELEKKSRFNRKVNVDVASHSPQMNVILDELKNSLATVKSVDSSIQFYSTVISSLVSNGELNAEYWCENLRNPVQFLNAIQYALQEKNVVFIEMSPHPTLLHAVNENIENVNANAFAVASFVKNKNEHQEFYSNLSELHDLGYPVDFKHFYPTIYTFVHLPNYAWQKERYWFDTTPVIPAISSSLDRPLSNKNFYEINWQEISPDFEIKPANILLIKDAHGYYKKIEEQLLNQNFAVTLVDVADDVASENFDIVVHSGSLNTDETFGLSLESGVLSLQRIVKQFSEKLVKPKICIVTNGAYVLMDDNQLNLNASLIAGALGSIQNEYPEFNFVHVDLSFSIIQKELDFLMKLLSAEQKYKHVAIRKQKLYTPLLQNLETLPGKSVDIVADGTYLITGGTSGLGLEFAKWLSKNGAKNIALVSRSGEHPETKTAIELIEKNNTTVFVYKADISHLTHVTELLNTIESTQPKIVGVIHAAAVLEDGLFLNLSKEQFINPVLSKGIGLWNLNLALKNHSLSSFIVCSSAANLLGTSAQANYNAANQMVDSLISFRRKNNLSGTTVNWGNIASVGMAAQHKVRGERLAEQGIDLIYPDELSAYFDLIFSDKSGQVVPLKINFQKWSETNESVKNNYFFSKVLPVKEAEINQKNIFNQTSLQNAIQVIKQVIKQNISVITKIPVSKIKEDDTFKSIGIDSLMALQLKNKLQTIYSLSLNVSSVWAHPTVEKYAAFIAEELKLPEKYQMAADKPLSEEINSENSVKKLSLDELMKELNSKVN
jgi:acyl transferase domain-containing protein/short-subunit dehydrogenase/acyl carrier protein